MKFSVSLLMAAFLLTSCNGEEKKEYATVTVQKTTVQTSISLSGRVESAQQISLIAPEDITVLQLDSSNGQRVKKDDVLCKLDPKVALEKIVQETSKGDQLRAQIKTAKIRLEGLKKDLEKSKRLYTSGAVSLEDKEKQEQEFEIQTTQLTVVEGDLKNNDITIERLKKEAQLLDMKAPFDGVVTYIWTTKDSFIPGSSVKKGDLLFKLSSEGKMMVKTTLREQDVVHFSQGQKLDLAFPGVPDAQVQGIVKLVDNSATIDKDSGIASFRIQVEFTPPAGIKPGMEASINHIVSQKDNVVAIPKTSINVAGTPNMEVMTILDGKKIKKSVKTGLIGDMTVEIISGLNPGELVMANYEE